MEVARERQTTSTTHLTPIPSINRIFTTARTGPGGVRNRFASRKDQTNNLNRKNQVGRTPIWSKPKYPGRTRDFAPVTAAPREAKLCSRKKSIPTPARQAVKLNLSTEIEAWACKRCTIVNAWSDHNCKLCGSPSCIKIERAAVAVDGGSVHFPSPDDENKTYLSQDTVPMDEPVDEHPENAGFTSVAAKARTVFSDDELSEDDEVKFQKYHVKVEEELTNVSPDDLKIDGKMPAYPNDEDSKQRATDLPWGKMPPPAPPSTPSSESDLSLDFFTTPSTLKQRSRRHKLKTKSRTKNKNKVQRQQHDEGRTNRSTRGIPGRRPRHFSTITSTCCTPQTAPEGER